MNSKNPKWECPVCYSKIKTSDLQIDGYFEDILLNTPEDCDSVQIESDRTWAIPNAKNVVQVSSVIKRPFIAINDSPDAPKKSNHELIVEQKQFSEVEIIVIDSSDDDIPLSKQTNQKGKNPEPALSFIGVTSKAAAAQESGTFKTNKITTVSPGERFQQFMDATCDSEDEYW
jgi:hypothetical protein